MKQTKAERIFKATYIDSIIYIERHGFDENASWDWLKNPEKETVAIRTLNAIDRLIDSEFSKIEHFEKFTIKHPGNYEYDEKLLASYAVRKQALVMTRNTVELVRCYLTGRWD